MRMPWNALKPSPYLGLPFFTEWIEISIWWKKFQNDLVTDWYLQLTCSQGTKNSSQEDKRLTRTFYYLQIPKNTVKINFDIFVITKKILVTKISKLIFTVFLEFEESKMF